MRAHPEADGPQQGEPDEIRLTLPALVEYARIARLTVTGLASRMGYSYDEVEDLRIAVGEVCSVLLGDGGGRLAFVCTLADDALTLVAERVPAAPPTEVGELSRQILEAVVDELHVDADRARLHLVKRRRR